MTVSLELDEDVAVIGIDKARFGRLARFWIVLV